MFPKNMWCGNMWCGNYFEPPGAAGFNPNPPVTGTNQAMLLMGVGCGLIAAIIASLVAWA